MFAENDINISIFSITATYILTLNFIIQILAQKNDEEKLLKGRLFSVYHKMSLKKIL